MRIYILQRTALVTLECCEPHAACALLERTCPAAFSLVFHSLRPGLCRLQDARYTKAKKYADAKFKIFDIAPYGVPYALWGFIFIVVVQVSITITTFGATAVLAAAHLTDDALELILFHARILLLSSHWHPIMHCTKLCTAFRTAPYRVALPASGQ